MPKLIDYWVDVLIVALLIALGSYVVWKGGASRTLVQPKSAGIERMVCVRQGVLSGEAAGAQEKIVFVMAGLVPAIHVFTPKLRSTKDVDARNKSGHDGQLSWIRR